MFIFGAYLRSDESLDMYINEINMLVALVSCYSNYGSIKVAGDLNASCHLKDSNCSNQRKLDELIKFIKKYNLSYSGGSIKATTIFLYGGGLGFFWKNILMA